MITRTFNWKHCSLLLLSILLVLILHVSCNGTSVSKVMILKAKAEQGDAKAQCQLGECYLTGKVVERDNKEAIKWFRKSAEQGYVKAQIMLGVCYEYGKVVELDYNEALKWYTKAAEQGDTYAKKHVEALEKKLEAVE